MSQMLASRSSFTSYLCSRFTSRSLIEISPIRLVSFLMGGAMIFLRSAYRRTIHNMCYRTLARDVGLEEFRLSLELFWGLGRLHL